MPTTTLYRLFDAEGALLYVGITSSDAARLGQHALDKRWWCSVATAKFEHCATREEARVREAGAIKGESPLFNIRGVPRAPAPEPAPIARPLSPDGEWASVREAASYIGRSRRAVNKYIQQGKLPAYKAPVGGRTLVKIADLEAFRQPQPRPPRLRAS